MSNKTESFHSTHKPLAEVQPAILRHPIAKQQVKAERIINTYPDDLTIASLSHFLSSQNLVDHGLHGAIGKAYDVLCAAAKVASGGATTTAWPGDFISVSELKAAIIKNGLSDQTALAIIKRIQNAAEEQLVSGRPTVNGEVVIEGDTTRRLETSRHWDIPLHVEYVAVASLGVIASQYKPPSKAPVALREIMQTHVIR